MQEGPSIDFKYRTARKDYEDCVLLPSINEVISIEHMSVIKKLIGVHKHDEENMMEAMENMRCGVWFYIDYDHPNVFVGKQKK